MANQNDTQGWCHFNTNTLALKYPKLLPEIPYILPELTLLPEITFAGNFFHFHRIHVYIFVCKAVS